MFEDSLIESGGKLKTSRGATAGVSFLIQLGMLVVLVVIPLLFTEALPKNKLMASLLAPPPLAPMPGKPTNTARRRLSKMLTEPLRMPTSTSHKIESVEDVPSPPSAIGAVNSLKNGSQGQPDGVLTSLFSTPLTAVPKIATPKRVILSQGVIQGMLLRRVQPGYPPLARQARIQGTVKLQAEISRDGSIQNLRLLSGHAMLAPSAIEAVKQWRYKPYVLNGEPVEVETTITVNFTLEGG